MTNVPNLRFKEFSEEWISSKLDDVSTQIGDGIHATPGYVDISEISFINGNNIKDHKIIINENTKCISEEELKKYKVNLNNNSILMSINGTIGNIGYYNNEKVLLGKSVAYININPNIINKFFLGSLLETDKVQRKFMSELTGTTIKNLSLKSIRDCKLNVPSIVEQEKIGSFFSLIDKKIELQTEKVEELKNYKKGIMQKIFSQELRFKDESGNEYQNWTKCKIYDCFIERSEKGFEDLELLSVSMEKGVIKRSEIESKDNSSENKSNYKLVKKDDIVYNSMRMWQGASGLSEYEGIVSPAYTVLTPKKDIYSSYFADLFKMHKMIHEFRKYSQGLTSDTWNLKYPQIKDIQVNIPSYEEQIKISQFFKMLDNKVEIEQQKLYSLIHYKKGLLQQMFI